jgi:hypothetical protein
MAEDGVEISLSRESAAPFIFFETVPLSDMPQGFFASP